MKTGWEVKSIGDFCTLNTGGTPKRSESEYYENGKIKWLVSGDIHKKEIDDCEGRITELGLEKSNARYLPLNSIMIALNGQGKTRGTVAMLRTNATCNQSLVSISPNDPEAVIPEYIFANLRGRYEEIRKMTGDTGNDRRGLNMPLIRSIKIPIAPIEEQKRIVAILDEAFAGLDRARAHTEANLQNARDLFESVLASVFETEASEFEVKRLDDICDVRDGTHDSPKYVSEGVPLVTQKNVRDEGLTFNKCKNISLADHEKIHKRSNVSEGDILISMIGVNRGMTCLVDVPDVFSIKNVGLIKQTDEFNMNYLLYYLKSRPALEYVSAETNGGAQPFIGLKKLRAFPVAYAPIKSQNMSVSFLDGAKGESDKLITLYKAKLTDLDDLRQSLLQKAFAGKLT